jgi:rod shape-determining protein MreC
VKIIAGSPTRMKILANLVILVLATHSFFKKELSKEDASAFQRLTIGLTAPLQGMVVSAKQSIYGLFDHYAFIVNAGFENDILKKKVEELEGTIFQLQELRRENKRLKKLLKFGVEPPYRKILAQIIGWDASSDYQVIRINKGSRDGVTLKATVATNSGLVGHVHRVAEKFADILTILDQSNRIDALVDETRSQGIVQGLSDSTCLMKYVTRTEPVKVGNTVLTAGLGNIYPKGLKVGTISKIEKESYGITQFIVITPSVNFRKLEEVVVLEKGEGL